MRAKLELSGVNPQLLLWAGLTLVAVYFSVMLVQSLRSYLRFRKVRATALLTWRGPAPPYFRFVLFLGGTSAALAVLALLRTDSWHSAYSQGVMALYFMLMVPLTARIPLGFYAEGIWSQGGFIPYTRIERWSFSETPEIVLVLLPRGGRRAFRLPVPAAEYGAVRKVLEEKIRGQLVNAKAILGL